LAITAFRLCEKAEFEQGDTAVFSKILYGFSGDSLINGAALASESLMCQFDGAIACLSAPRSLVKSFSRTPTD